MKTIFFVRHGESEANAKGMLQGTSVNTPLTENGRRQAKKVGQDLKNKKIELVVSSLLIRTYETAKIISNEIDYDTDKIVVNDLFTERDYGIYTSDNEGLSGRRYMQDLAAGKLHESAETTEATYGRIVKGLDWLKGQKASRNLIVGHGGSGRVFKLIQRNMPHHGFYEIERFDNTESYKFKL